MFDKSEFIVKHTNPSCCFSF